MITNDKAPTVAAVEALNEVQGLEDLLDNTARRLLETHLGIPVDRRCKRGTAVQSLQSDPRAAPRG